MYDVQPGYVVGDAVCVYVTILCGMCIMTNLKRSLSFNQVLFYFVQQCIPLQICVNTYIERWGIFITKSPCPKG